MQLPSFLLICVFCAIGEIFAEGQTCPPLLLGSNMATEVNVTSVKATGSGPVIVTCYDGFTLATGETTQHIQCEEVGLEAQWNISLAECLPVLCTVIPEVTQAHVIYNSTSYGSMMSVVCTSGHTRESGLRNISFICNATGHWETLDNASTNLDCNYIVTGYKGCTQSMSDLTVSVSNISGVSTCIAHCKSQEKPFSGINGGNCYCQTNLTSFGNKVDDIECNTMCDFNQDTFCGGPDSRFSVYSVFDGCFSITDPSVFGTSIPIVGSYETACMEYCRGLEYKFALVKRTNKCQCTNIISNITASSLLIMMCEKSSRQLSELGITMDKETTVRVWTLDLSLNPRTGDSCGDLYENGVLLHGNYYTGDTTKTWCNFKDGTICDPYWVGYQGSCYLFSTSEKTYNDSSTYCLENDAHMVSATSQLEEEFLEEAIFNFASYRSENNVWHLGLYDSHGSASFQWNDGSMLTYTNFLSSEPSRPFEARCTAIIRDDEVKWYDQKCVEEESFICKKQPDLYYGCIEVTTTVLSVTVTHSDMTIGMCSQKCLSLGHTYSAVNGETCYCFDTVPSHVTLSWSSCDIQCPGHLYQPCGGYNDDVTKTTIFVTGGSSSPVLAESCDQLEEQGLKEDIFLTTAGQLNCSSDNAVVCPFSWIAVDGHCYKFMVGSSDTPSTTCATNGAYLASFTDEKELMKIRDVINSVGTYRYYDWWLGGLSDMGKNKVFRWSNGQYFNHSAFVLTHAIDKKCNAFDRLSNNSEFVTSRCTDKPFVCEMGSDYVGCFETPLHTAILSGYKDMTVSVCVELCRGQGRLYGLLDVTSCWCNDSLDMATSKSFSTCTAFCVLSVNGQPCGGEGHVSAFHVASFPEYAETCEDVFQQGILVPGTYIIAGEAKYCTLSDNTTCPASGSGSWIGVGQDGYCLMVSLDKESDTDAVDLCRARGGVLASARDTTEWDFLKQVIKFSITLSDASGILLGVRDEFQNGLYSWADGSIMTFGLPEILEDMATNGIGSVGTLSPSLTLYNKATTKDWHFLCSTEKEYDGCYENVPVSPLISDYQSMTLTLCRQLCLGQGHQVALLHITDCSCARESDLSGLQRHFHSDCEVSCQGHSGQNCAKGSKMRAYKIENTGLAENCSDLYASGVIYYGTYQLYDPNSQATHFQQCGFDINDFPCPPGWMAHNRTCLQIYPLPKSQTEASEFCFQKGGYLFTPKYQETFEYVANLITSVPQWSEYSKWRTGAREVMLEGYLVLADGVYMMSQDLKDDVFFEDVCVVFNITTRTLHRDNCDEELLPFICEMDQAMTGCHVTDSSSTYGMSSTNEMSVSLCMEYCRGQPGNNYFALQNSTCYCYDTYNILSTGVCTTRCVTQPNQQCGGVSDMSVYEIAPYSDTVLSSCKELYLYGVTMEGWYRITYDDQSTNVLCFNYGSGYNPVLGADSGTITASSETPGYSANSARLGSGEMLPSSWKPDTSEESQWLELDLPDLYLIKAVFTQGGQSLMEQAWVTSYSIKHSIQGSDWTSYPNTLTGNTDRSSVRREFLSDPFLCDRVRLELGTQTRVPAMRVELLGEVYSDFDHGDRYVGCFVDVIPREYDNKGVVSSFSQCLDECTSGTIYPFMALADDSFGSTVCRCGMTVGQYGQVSSSKCSQPCDFPEVTCGTDLDSVLAVYRTYEKHCPDRASPVNSTRTVTKVYNVTDTMTFQTIVTYTCITGYEFPDHSIDMSLTCLQTNDWNGTVPDCQVKHCDPPVDALHAGRDSNDTAYNSVITYTCDPGCETSMGNTTQTIICQDSRSWSVDPQPCTPRPCDVVPTVFNSIILEDTNNLVYGDSLTYKCHPSSMFNDTSITKNTTCGTDGQWSPIPSECQYYACPPAPFVPGAVGEYLNDFFLRYTCQPDYQFEDGSPEINSTCDSDNTWSPITKQCIFSATAKKRESRVCMRKKNEKIKSGIGSVEVTSSRSSLSCGVLCLQNPACRYYNYNNAAVSKINNCELFVDTTANFNFEANSGWDAYILRDDC